jgi:tetratricopeptide (TPR) repeat protein
LGIYGQQMAGRRAVQVVELLAPAATEFADLGDTAALAMLEHQLARGYWLSERRDEAIGHADRALGRAERLGDLPQIADILITKGSLISMSGRSFEGNALLKTGQQLAETNGWWQTAIRGLINISAGDFGRNPLEGLNAAREAMALARRFGYRSSLATASGNALEAAARMGEWEWVVTEGRRVMEEDLDEADRFNVVRGIEEVLAYRGDDVSEMLEQHRRYSEESGNVIVVSNYHGAAAAYRFARGDYASAAREWRLSGDLNAVNMVADIPRAARAAIWAEDLETAKELLDKFDSLTVHSKEADAARSGMGAGIAALEGRRDEAVAKYSTALPLWEELNVLFDGALVGVEMARTLSTEEPVVQTALAKSRATFESLGATPFVELADRLASRSFDGAANASSADSTVVAAAQEVEAKAS